MNRHNRYPVPVSRAEMRRLGWDRLDVLLVTGDAVVDHPSFGSVLLARWLIDHGFRVGLVAQPRWDRPDDVARLGRPRLFAGVSAGALDSMLARYTAFRRPRREDAYTPGGRAGARPKRASIVYTNLVRRAFSGLVVVLGGIEASLRRASHFDFWSGRLRRSVLLEAKADLVVQGMGERAVLRLAQDLDGLERGGGVDRGRDEVRQALRAVPGAVFAASGQQTPEGAAVQRLPSHEGIVDDPSLLMRATLDTEAQVHRGDRWSVQPAGDRLVHLAPPAPPLSTAELDQLYALPFSRQAHPSYRQRIPALDTVRFSVTSHRGCAGGCTFCSLALHQGRSVRSRSRASLVDEVRGLTQHPGWRGSISDVGGPTANMWGARCAADPSVCARQSCLHPKKCPHFRVDQNKNLKMLRDLAGQPTVKHLRVASGLRHDLFDPSYLSALVGEFCGGQLKLAPEHAADPVLKLMRKPPFAMFERLSDRFSRTRRGKGQYIVPYLMSAFPGTTDDQMRQLARWLKKRGWRPRQVQCFVPTPGTVATAMFFAGIDPKGKPIHVAKTDAQRRRQHRILLGKQR